MWCVSAAEVQGKFRTRALRIVFQCSLAHLPLFVQCNGERPKCSACHDRGTDCEYDTNVAETHAQALKRKYDELSSTKSAAEKVFEILRTKDEKEAGEVFQRIRRGADAATILRHITFGDTLIQLACSSDTGYRYEFPYLPDMPAFLQRHDNVYLDSEVYACVLRRPAPSGPSSVSVEHRQHMPHQPLLGSQQQPYFTPLNPSRSMSPYPTQRHAVDSHSDPYHKPYHSATVENSRLDKLHPSQWTSVSTDDNLMRRFLHDYIMYDYGWNYFLHLDYFLDDMANGRHRFCSRLLVNTVLCIGSVRVSKSRKVTLSTDLFSSITIVGSKVGQNTGIPPTLFTCSWQKPSDFLRSTRNLNDLYQCQTIHTASGDSGSGKNGG